MLTLVLLLCATQSQTPTINRDTYGVPQITASSWNDAFFQQGFAVA